MHPEAPRERPGESSFRYIVARLPLLRCGFRRNDRRWIPFSAGKQRQGEFESTWESACLLKLASTRRHVRQTSPVFLKTWGKSSASQDMGLPFILPRTRCPATTDYSQVNRPGLPFPSTISISKRFIPCEPSWTQCTASGGTSISRFGDDSRPDYEVTEYIIGSILDIVNYVLGKKEESLIQNSLLNMLLKFLGFLLRDPIQIEKCFK